MSTHKPLPPPPPSPLSGVPAAPGPGPFGRGQAEQTRNFLIAVAGCLVSALIGISITRFHPLLFVGGILALVGGVVIFVRPYVGLLFYALLFVLRPGELYPVLGALHLERLIGVVTLAGIFLGMIRRHGEILFDMSPQTKWLWLFTGAIALSIPLSYWMGHSIDTLVDMMKIMAFYIMIVYLIDTRLKLKVFIWLYLLLIGFLGTTSLIAYYTGGSFFAQGIDRAVGVTSAGGGANELGTTLASILPIFIVLVFVETANWRRAVAGLGSLIALWGMVLTGSRASMLGCVAGIVYLWWKSKNRVLTGVLGLMVLGIGIVAMPDQYKTRYSSMTKSELDGSSKGRIEAWMTGAQMVIDRPLFGVGAGCFGTARAMNYSGTRKNYLESHSLYIQVVTELGLFGAAVFAGLLYNFLGLNRRTTRLIEGAGKSWRWEYGLMIGLFTGFIVLIMSGFFGHSLYRRTWYVYAALGLAVLRIYKSHRAASGDVIS